jgi:hypothetical protein
MKLKYLVIHCTATPSGMKVTPHDIKFWHTSPPPQGRGWKQVGYSDMILADGTVINLVPYNEDSNVDAWEITNGATGINGISRHVVYVGGSGADLKGKDTRTPQQWDALKRYVLKTIELHPDIKVAGHNQFAKKDCPSFDVPSWCRIIGVDYKNIHLPTPSIL